MKINSITVAITILSAATIFGAAAYTRSKMPDPEKADSVTVNVDTEQDEQQVVGIGSAPVLQKVAVQNTHTSTYQAEVVGYGESHSQYELTYTSEVSGRVLTMSEDFATGKVVKKSTLLAKIDDTSYRQALAEAEASVASAELALLEEQRQGVQAKLEWERSGLSGQPDSPLVLREPQLANAQATLKNAQQSLKKAQQDLDNTLIRAPFDALVVTRDLQPGSYVQAGSQIATLYSVESVEIAIPLAQSQWNTLPRFDNSQAKSWTVSLSSADNQSQWQGYVARTEQHLSQDTRQRSLIVKVDSPLQLEPPLFPGTFVTANIPGSSLDNLWQVPASAISQQGDIWLVDEQGLLGKASADIRFAKESSVYISPVNDAAVARVVKRPLSSFQASMKVEAVVEGGDE